MSHRAHPDSEHYLQNAVAGTHLKTRLQFACAFPLSALGGELFKLLHEMRYDAYAVKQARDIPRAQVAETLAFW